MQLSREAIQRMVEGQYSGGMGTAGGGSSTDQILNILQNYPTLDYLETTLQDYVTNSELETTLASYATKTWVDQNYLSISFFSALFQARTSGGAQVAPNSGDVTTITNIKAMFGFWTDQYLSALGQGSGGGGGQGDVTWDALQNNSDNRPIALSHLASALVGYVTLTDLATTLDSYATKAWVGQQGYLTGITSSMVTTALGYTPANVTALSDYLPLSGGTLTGLLTVSSTGSNRATIHLVSSADVPNDLYFGSNGSRHWSLTSRPSAEGNTFYLYNAINSADALLFNRDSEATFYSSVTATSFIKKNGTSSQFLKADGSVDNNSYLPLSGGTITGGQLSIRPTGGNYTDGIRIHARSSDNCWAAVVLCGSENTGDFGTSANTWFIGAELGNFFIARNGTGETGSGTTYLRCISNVWDIDGNTIIHSGNIGSQSVLSAAQLTTSRSLWGNSFNGTGDITNSIIISTPKSGETDKYIQIGDIKLVYDSSNEAIKVVHTVANKVASLWAEGGIAALGSTGSGGGGGQGDVTWDALRDGNDSRPIALSHLTTALAGYATQTWVGQQGYLTGITSSMITTALGYTPANVTALSNYLPLTGGTLTGSLTLTGNGTARAQIFLISSGDYPNDLYFGSNGDFDWSISSRGTSEGKYIGLFNNSPIGWVYQVAITTGVLNFLYRPTYNGTNLALTSEIPTNNNQLTNGAGYVTSSGVTSVATGTGLTGGTITSTGTISIDSTYQTYISHGESAYNSLSSYLPLSGGTLTGELDIYASSGRSTLRVVTPSNEPCDLWLGANSLSKWSLTCRDFNEGYNLDIFSVSATENGGHVVVFNPSGRAHFYESIHAAKHLCIGSDLTTYSSIRAELDICSSSNDASELWYGVGGSRYWSVCCRPSYENYIYAFYSSVSQGYMATLDHNGNFYVYGSLGVGTSPSYKLHVNGESYFASWMYVNSSVTALGIELKPSSPSAGHGGHIDFHYNQSSADYTTRLIEDASGQLKLIGDFYATGGVTALVATSSDIRKKNVMSYELPLTINEIAEAPTIKFTWKENKSITDEQVGTIAQYWQKVLPQTVKMERDESLSLQYGVAALISAITTARTVVDHERRISQLERENDALREAYSFIKNAYDELKLKIA